MVTSRAAVCCCAGYGGMMAGRRRTRLQWLCVLVVALHIAGAWLLGLGCWRGLPLLGIGGLAYLLGLRHAFDIDHIAAIDNVTRTLRQDGKRPVFAGFLFSLGHSSVVIGLSLAILLTLRHGWNGLGDIGFWGRRLGAAVSATALTVLGILNASTLVALLRSRRQRAEGWSAAQIKALDQLLARRGLMARVLRPLHRWLDASWKMYPLGLLFGLGFDTASEIGVLALSAVAARQADFPLWLLMAFPLLFTAAMTLVDSLDGVLMIKVYDGAMRDPDQRLIFNILTTGLSVVVALTVGLLEWRRLAIVIGGGDIRPGLPHAAVLGLLLTAALLALWGLARASRSVTTAVGGRADRAD